jgi:signal transduction histidine kinase
MSILTRDRRRFSDGEVELARSFAGQAAVAITNSRLYEDARRHAQRLAEMNQLGALVVSTLDRDEVLRRIVHAGQRLLSAELARLWLLDAGAEQLLLAADAGSPGGSSGSLRSIRVEGSLYGHVLREGRPFCTPDVQAEPLLKNRAFIERQAFRACLIAPLLHEGNALGVLSVLARGERRFRDEDVDLLQALASFAALALGNAWLADEVGRLEGLRQLDQLKGEFLATVSHELRTPLSYIHGYAELLSLRDVSPEQVKDMAGEIYRGSTTMARMVDDLLDFSRLEAGRLTLRVQPTDLAELLATTGHSVVGPSAEHHLRLDLPPDLPRVAADPDRLRQILSGLLSNALRYSAGGEIALRARSDGGQVWIEVEDHGVGIAPEEQERVFEKFYRARGSVLSSVRGSGLGLAMARNLVEAHGGVIRVTSPPGQGSVFSFCLPVALPSGRHPSAECLPGAPATARS